MNTSLLIAVIVIVVVVLALAWLLMRQQRTGRLRKQFGPEYERAVSDAGNRRAAESELEDRRARRRQLEIVPLPAAVRDRYLQEWRLVQARFVDSPPEATRAADRLITAVMRDRGYPMEDFEQRAADVSVDHPQVVDDYRTAHSIAEANERSQATTEDLRKALVHYRSLFEDLVEPDGSAEPRAGDGAPVTREPGAAMAREGDGGSMRERPDPAVTGDEDATQDGPAAGSRPPSERRTR